MPCITRKRMIYSFSLEEGLRRTIDYEFVKKFRGIHSAVSDVCIDN